MPVSASEMSTICGSHLHVGAIHLLLLEAQSWCLVLVQRGLLWSVHILCRQAVCSSFVGVRLCQGSFQLDTGSLDNKQPAWYTSIGIHFCPCHCLTYSVVLQSRVPQEVLDTQVDPAAFEISGHVIMKRQQDYDALTQEAVWDLLSYASLSEESFIKFCNFALEE